MEIFKKSLNSKRNDIKVQKQQQKSILEQQLTMNEQLNSTLMNLVSEQQLIEKKRKIEIKEELMDDSIEFEKIEFMDTFNETQIKIHDKQILSYGNVSNDLLTERTNKSGVSTFRKNLMINSNFENQLEKLNQRISILKCSQSDNFVENIYDNDRNIFNKILSIKEIKLPRKTNC